MEHPRHILVVCCLVRNARQEVLLVRHQRRGWELPQGRVEEGEALRDGLHREVLEETGIEIAAAQPAVIWSKLSAPAAVIVCFTASYAAGQPTASEETPEVRWVTEEQALTLIEHPVNLDRFKGLLQHSGVLQLRSYTTGPYRVVDQL